MSYQAGSALQLEVEETTGDGDYITIGGLKAHNMNISGNTIDVTNMSSGGFREYLSGGGTRYLNISGDGTFYSDVASKVLNTLAINRELANWRITVPGMGVYEGGFAITTLSMSGTQTSELKFSLNLESGDSFTFTETETETA